MYSCPSQRRRQEKFFWGWGARFSLGPTLLPPLPIIPLFHPSPLLSPPLLFLHLSFPALQCRKMCFFCLYSRTFIASPAMRPPRISVRATPLAVRSKMIVVKRHLLRIPKFIKTFKAFNYIYISCHYKLR